MFPFFSPPTWLAIMVVEEWEEEKEGGRRNWTDGRRRERKGTAIYSRTDMEGRTALTYFLSLSAASSCSCGETEEGEEEEGGMIDKDELNPSARSRTAAFSPGEGNNFGHLMRREGRGGERRGQDRTGPHGTARDETGQDGTGRDAT